MRNVFMATVAAMAIGSAAVAEEEATVVAPLVGGSVAFEIAEDADGDMAGTTTLGLGINAEGLAFGGFELESVDGGTLEVDSWQIGTTALGFGTVSLGDQGDLMVGNDFEVVGGDTLADPAENESVILDMGMAAVMVGFTDLSDDVTDIENVQGSYTMTLGGLALTAVGDYNIDSEDYVLGGHGAYLITEDIVLGGLVTYDSASEAVGYEASAGYSFATVFANGDDSDALQNVGAGVATELGGLGLYAEGAYNLDREEETFAAGLSFNF
jgi:hypothetical protein